MSSLASTWVAPRSAVDDIKTPYQIQDAEFKKITGVENEGCCEDTVTLRQVSRATTLDELASCLKYASIDTDAIAKHQQMLIARGDGSRQFSAEVGKTIRTEHNGPSDKLCASGSLRVTIGELEADDHPTRGLAHLLSECESKGCESMRMRKLVVGALEIIHKAEMPALKLEYDCACKEARSGAGSASPPAQVDVRSKPTAKKKVAKKTTARKRSTTRTPPPTPVDATPNRPAERSAQRNEPIGFEARIAASREKARRLRAELSALGVDPWASRRRDILEARAAREAAHPTADDQQQRTPKP